MYVHKVVSGSIVNKFGLRNVLNAVSIRMKLIDCTIKIYDSIFFFFFHLPKSVALGKVIDAIQKSIAAFAQWDEDYMYTGVWDLGEKYVREYLEGFKFDYDKG